MKVVLFCGGKGMRLREYSDQIPKPMVPIGYRPILWHVMKYYAHFGHKDFILCLGYRADAIKQYFLNYDECVSNDFVLNRGNHEIKLLNSDIDDWNITFVDTGVETNIGGRLRAVEPFLRDEEQFLANYSDVLTDMDLNAMLGDFDSRPEAVASFLCVRPNTSFHLVSINGGNKVHSIRDVQDSDVWINGGFFVLRRQIFDYMREGDELVLEPFQRLIDEQRLIGYRPDCYWACMDTFKEKQSLEEMAARGEAPWELWQRDAGQTDSVRSVSLDAAARTPGVGPMRLGTCE